MQALTMPSDDHHQTQFSRVDSQVILGVKLKQSRLSRLHKIRRLPEHRNIGLPHRPHNLLRPLTLTGLCELLLRQALAIKEMLPNVNNMLCSARQELTNVRNFGFCFSRGSLSSRFELAKYNSYLSVLRHPVMPEISFRCSS